MPLDRALLGQLIGALPEAAPLAARTIASVDLGEIIREEVRYQVEPGEEVAAYFFRPSRQAQPVPAILCLHQHAGQFHLGKSEPAGLAGNPEQFYALELARQGYATLVADAICFEDRRHPTLEGAAYERFEFTRRIALGSSLQAKMLSDARRGVDYLQCRPEVDGSRIGCIGHSLGGQQTAFVAAMDERIAAAVSSCGFASYGTIFRNAINHNFALYVPGLLRHGEFGDILALVAPRPFLACYGTRDRIFPVDGIEQTIEHARAAYAARGVVEHLVAHAEDVGHGFTATMRAHVMAFFNQWLDAVAECVAAGG
ncbi:MAG: dienelactone hydrolase family protein [Chloroflexi bacterium]|nr:dienelactone hydrolase family protein [Chloroflexota bacterium]